MKRAGHLTGAFLHKEKKGEENTWFTAEHGPSHHLQQV